MLIKKIKQNKVAILLILILILGFWIRLNGLNWGLPYIYFDDETIFISIVENILQKGDWNPHYFNFPGTILIYCITIVYGLGLIILNLNLFLSGHLPGFSEIIISSNINKLIYYYQNPVLAYYLGRFVSVIFAIITIFLVYKIASYMFDRKTGLIAGLVLALAPLHIDQSRIIKVDIIATMFILVSFYYLIKFVDDNKNRLFLYLSSFFAGIAIGSKYPSVIIALLILFCIFDEFLNITGKANRSKYIINNIFKPLILIFFGFFISSPYLIFNFKTSLSGLMFETRTTHLGQERLEFINQNIWYIQRVLIDGTGGPTIFIVSLIGIFLLSIKFIRKLDKKILLLFFFFFAYYIFIVWFGNLRWERWLIPILPFFAIFFGYGVNQLNNHSTNLKTKANKYIVTLLIIFIISLTFTVNFIKELNKGEVLTRKDTREIAKIWIENNVPKKSSIVYEIFSPHLHVNKRNDLRLINKGWKLVISESILDYKSEKVDYIVISDIFKDLYEKEPNKYPDQIRKYRQLIKNSRLIKTFDNKNNPGPTIYVYKINY